MFGMVRIGVVIGARTLQAACLRKSSHSKSDWRYLQHPRSAATSLLALQSDLEALLGPWRKERFLAKLILGAPSSYIYLLDVELSSILALSEAVKEKLPTLLPFESERAQYVVDVRRQHRVEGHLDCSLALAACEYSSLQSELNALWKTGWTISAVAPSALAIAQAAKALGVLGAEPTVLIDIGERLTTIALSKAQEIVYARDVALGMEHLTDALMTQISTMRGTLALSREQAQALKNKVGIPDISSLKEQASLTIGDATIPAAAYLGMIQPVLEQLISEVGRTMSYKVSDSTDERPNRLIISGEGSRLANCERWFSAQLGVEVSRLSCEALVGPDGQAAALAVGLALLEPPVSLDLRPKTAKRRVTLQRAGAFAWRGIVGAIMCIWLSWCFWQSRRAILFPKLRALEHRWADIKPSAELQESVDSRSQLIQGLVAKRGLTVEWFRNLSRDFPVAVRLTRLTIGSDAKVSIIGEAQQREQSAQANVSALMLWLERSKICKNLQLGSTNRIDESGNLVGFSLTCQLP